MSSSNCRMTEFSPVSRTVFAGSLTFYVFLQVRKNTFNFRKEIKCVLRFLEGSLTNTAYPLNIIL